jgi:putative ribosome biogenesis GTPase RsgA
VFGGDQSAEYKKRLQKLAQIEQSRFAGQAGVGSASLMQSSQGQI